MASNLLQELEEHFNAFVETKDPDKFHSGIVSYFRFIEDTFPFNNIARALFSAQKKSVFIYNVSGLYQTFVFNKPNSTGSSIDPWSVGGSGISYFHAEMVAAAKKSGLGENIVQKEKRRAITKNIDNDYFYKEKKLPFQKDSIYYHIFDYLYGLASNEASYKDISIYLARNGFGVNENEAKQSERIRNAIKVYEKTKEYPKKIGNLRVLEVRRGFGVRLNSPEI